MCNRAETFAKMKNVGLCLSLSSSVLSKSTGLVRVYLGVFFLKFMIFMSIVSIVSIFMVFASVFALLLVRPRRFLSSSIAIDHVHSCLSCLSWVNFVSIVFILLISRLTFQVSVHFWLCLWHLSVSIVSIWVIFPGLSCLSCLSVARVYFSVSIVSILHTFSWLSCLSVSIVSIFYKSVYFCRVYPIFSCNRAETYFEKK